MKRNATAPARIHSESSSSSIGSSTGTLNPLASRPPFLSTSAHASSGRWFHKSRPSEAQEGQPNTLQSLNSTLGFFPRAGASPVHNAPPRGLQRTPADADTVRIKTRDPTSVSRRAAVKQSVRDSGRNVQVDALLQSRASSTLESKARPSRASPNRSNAADYLTAEDSATHSDSFYRDSFTDCAAATHPRSVQHMASLLHPQQLSPISEASNVSVSSSSFPRDSACDVSSDDGHVLTPLAPQHGAPARAFAHPVANSSPHPVSAVQQQADAHSGSTMIENIYDLIADSAPMQVRTLPSPSRLHCRHSS
jgi:hypothetical protein